MKRQCDEWVLSYEEIKLKVTWFCFVFLQFHALTVSNITQLRVYTSEQRRKMNRWNDRSRGMERRVRVGRKKFREWLTLLCVWRLGFVRSFYCIPFDNSVLGQQHMVHGAVKWQSVFTGGYTESLTSGVTRSGDDCWDCEVNNSGLCFWFLAWLHGWAPEKRAGILL